MFGKHCIKTYSQTQETVALTSGELEFYGIAKAATFNIDECKQTSFEIPQLKYNNFTYLFKVSCASSSSWIFYITNENSQV